MLKGYIEVKRGFSDIQELKCIKKWLCNDTSALKRVCTNWFLSSEECEAVGEIVVIADL